MNKISQFLIWLKQRSRWYDPLAIPVVVAIFLALTINNISTIETGIFLALLILVLWWRIDGRIPVVAALVGLVITAIVNTYANHSLSLFAATIAERIAVWVFFLLVIGVMRMIWEAREGV